VDDQQLFLGALIAHWTAIGGMKRVENDVRPSVTAKKYKLQSLFHYEVVFVTIT
jgi:hypothetical protein